MTWSELFGMDPDFDSPDTPEGPAQLVVVAFDVTAPTDKAAHVALCDLLASADLPGKAGIVSWWFLDRAYDRLEGQHPRHVHDGQSCCAEHNYHAPMR